MKREIKKESKKPGKFVPPPDPVLQALPTLAEAVADVWWDDGSPREPYGLSVNWASGMVLAQLNDKEEERSLATTAETLQEALSQLNELLQRPSLPWRYWGKGRKKKGS